MTRRLLPLTLAAILLLSLAAIPATQADSGAATVNYVPSTPDAGAFFARIEANAGTQCVTADWSWTFPAQPGIPWLFSYAYGGTTKEAGQNVATDVNGRDILRGWGTTWDPYSQGDSHFMVNASVGDHAIFYHYNQTGYNSTSTGEIGGGASVLSCGGDGSLWFAFVGTPRVEGATLRFDFWERFNATTWTGVHGAASGAIMFASDSNRTFLKQLKDFNGTASFNGDPLALGAGPNAAGANVEATIHATRGLAGGFADLHLKDPSLSALSYVGPQGYVGAQSQTLQLSPLQTFSTFDGPAGDWTFNAHLYATPQAYASLYLWGADIATS